MLALIIGTLLAVGALVVVLYPLFVGAAPVSLRVTSVPMTAGSAEQEAVVALREIEFDRATGKLSDGDYTELHARYTTRALEAMRAAGGDVSAAADPVEAAVLAFKARMKSCGNCGPRPEPDATYCSNCGLYLPGTCAGCGQAVTEPAASFCAKCGRQLAA